MIEAVNRPLPPSVQRKSRNVFRIVLSYALVLVVACSFLLGYLIGGSQDSGQIGDSVWSDISSQAASQFSGTTVDADLYWQVWSAISRKYVDQPINPDQAVYGSIKGMVAGLGDPYSVFFDPEEAKAFDQEISGAFGGVGAEIGMKDDNIVVIAPLAGTPAERSGLLPGDTILQIDDADTTGMSVDQAVSLIRGEPGSTVRLLIFREGMTEAQLFEIVRETISPSSVDWEMLPSKIAKISIASFTQDTASQFQKAVTELLVQEPTGWVIDLRSNPGGYLDVSIEVAGEFIGNEVAVIEEYTQGEREEHRSDGSGRLRGQPIAVLVNQGTASAAEILAGALQDYGVASIIGQQTFGKGTVQDYAEFDDGSSLKLTVARWLTPKGQSINKAGITPGIVVEYTAEDAQADRDPQLDRAIEELSKGQ